VWRDARGRAAASQVDLPVWMCRRIYVVLTTAHLDRDPANNADENLAALCRRCHLVYDAPHHRQTARLRRDRETGQLRLDLVATGRSDSWMEQLGAQDEIKESVYTILSGRTT
jgi:hypothetical protein